MVRHIIVVTGANGGIGFGICHRLLVQLCSPHPTDALPQSFVHKSNTNTTVSTSNHAEYDSLTLIMACRSAQRGEAAREKLLNLLDVQLAQLQTNDGRARAFREKLVIDVVPLDLASISSVFKFSEIITATYPYISRLICNAGVASFCAIDWRLCAKQLLKEPINAVTAPAFYTQHSGEISDDGLGWVWQCNLFGHYVLYRTLQSHLLSSPPSVGARVVWMSSLEASPTFYDPLDWQLKDTAHSYEGVKYQIDLIATHLDRLALSSSLPNDNKAEAETRTVVRHFVTEPGVCSTNVANALIGPVLDWCKILVFYLVRFFGSPHHTIDPFKAAIAAVHVSLVSLAFLTLSSPFSQTSHPVKYSAQTDRWAEPRVGIIDVKNFDTHAEEGRALLDKMDGLYQEFEGKRLAGGRSKE